MRREKGILVFDTSIEWTEGEEESEEMYNGFEGIVVTIIPESSSIYNEASILCEEMYFSKESTSINARILIEEIPISSINTDSIDEFLKQIRKITGEYTNPFNPEVAIDSELESFILNK